MSQAEGWFADPYGRFEHRFYDGLRWTAHVSTGGNAQIDPAGFTPSAPASPPPPAGSAGVVPPPAPVLTGTEPTPPAAAAGPSLRERLDQLGPDAKERPAASLHTALAGAGGAFVGAGVILACIGQSFSRGRAFVAGLLAVGGGVAIRMLLPKHLELGAAAVGLGAVGIAAIAGATVGDSVSALPFVVATLLYLAAWVAPGFRGRPLMVGLGAFSVVLTLAAATTSDGAFCDEYSCSTEDVLFEQLQRAGVAFLVSAALLLGLVWLSDRHGFRGIGTGLAASALLAAAIGTGATMSNLGGVGGGILIALVGLIICAVGSHGARRATTWYGATTAANGIVALMVGMFTPESTGDSGALLVVGGLLLIGIPIAIAQRKTIAAALNTSATPPA